MKAAALATRIGQGPVIAAAAKVFAARGYEATRVEDILEESGIARRTFYKYFSSKDDVLAAVYDLATSELLRSVRDVEWTTPLVGVRRGLDVFLDYHVENAALLRVLLEQALRSGSRLWTSRARFREDLVHLMDAAVVATSGTKNDPMLYAALVSALEGISLDLLVAGAKPPDVARAKKVMHVILDRVVAPAPAEKTAK